MIGTEIEDVRGVPCVRAVMEDLTIALLLTDMGVKPHPCGFCPVQQETPNSRGRYLAFRNFNAPEPRQPECSPCTKRGGVYVTAAIAPMLRMRSKSPT